MRTLPIRPLSSHASLDEARRLGAGWGALGITRADAEAFAPPAGSGEWLLFMDARKVAGGREDAPMAARERRGGAATTATTGRLL